MGARKTKKTDGPKRKKMEPTCENKKWIQEKQKIPHAEHDHRKGLQRRRHEEE